MRLIDADALVEQMEAEAEYCEDSICKLVYEMDIRDVKRAPTVDAVERKKGKWLYADDVFEDAVCSSCKWDSGETMQHARKTFKFCPNCGAEMRGETNE